MSAEAEERHRDLFAPHRWWRVTYSDKRGGIQVWCETSDEDEARTLLSTCPGEPVLERLYRCTASEWRVQQ